MTDFRHNLMQSGAAPGNPIVTTGETLDATQYTVPSILQYEMVYGEDFISPGGREMATELIATLSLPAGSRVLDVGCGLGGSAFVMAQDFDFNVEGIDLSANMIAMARDRLVAKKLQHKVSLQLGDCLQIDRQKYYDAVYSRDVFLHIEDKGQLLSVLYRSLKPNGRLLFTDYCCGEKPWQPAFESYVLQRQYHLATTDQYTSAIKDAGFRSVTGKDITARFIKVLENELERISRLEEDPSTRKNLEAAWRQKIDRARTGDQRWGMFSAMR